MIQENSFTRPIGEKFQVRLDEDRVVTLQVCEEEISKSGSPECADCYLKHTKIEQCEYGNLKTLPSLDCWKFKLHSHASECWSAFRTDGVNTVFRKVEV